MDEKLLASLVERYVEEEMESLKNKIVKEISAVINPNKLIYDRSYFNKRSPRDLQMGQIMNECVADNYNIGINIILVAVVSTIVSFNENINEKKFVKKMLDDPNVISRLATRFHTFMQKEINAECNEENKAYEPSKCTCATRYSEDLLGFLQFIKNNKELITKLAHHKITDPHMVIDKDLVCELYEIIVSFLQHYTKDFQSVFDIVNLSYKDDILAFQAFVYNNHSNFFVEKHSVDSTKNRSQSSNPKPKKQLVKTSKPETPKKMKVKIKKKQQTPPSPKYPKFA